MHCRLRVLLVPDSVYWITGTIAKSITRFNPWIESTIASGPVIDTIFKEHPDLMRNFDLVHFTCPYAFREWLPRFRDLGPCVTIHHHVTNWEAIKHNLDGDAIIVGAPEWAEDLRARGGDISKPFCVPYGVDAEQFTPATEAARTAIRRRLGISPDATVVGFFGKNSSNDDDRKGIDVSRGSKRRAERDLVRGLLLVHRRERRSGHRAVRRVPGEGGQGTTHAPVGLRVRIPSATGGSPWVTTFGYPVIRLGYTTFLGRGGKYNGRNTWIALR